MKEMWDSRYGNSEYAYGTAPNAFFKTVIDTQNLSGKILLPAEGEGRNAIYAAKKGLEVFAFDISIEGKHKAEKLANQENVTIHYEVGEFFNLELVNEKFDVAALIFAHFPPPILAKYYQKVAELLKPNGILILEGFSTNHLELRTVNPKIGGPGKIEMLFSEDTIKSNFPNFEIIQLEEVEVELKEGLYHNGIGKVMRFVGRKV